MKESYKSLNDKKYGWWVYDNPKVTTSRSINAGKYSFSVKYCEVCYNKDYPNKGLSWETERFGDKHKHIRVIHYDNIPINGMKREVCPDCKQKYLKEK